MAEKTEAELAAEKAKLEKEVDNAATAAGKEAEAKGASEEEVKTAVEKARKEEKDKLYPQIEALKNGMAEIQQALREEKAEKEQIKKDQQEREEAERKAKMSSEDRQSEAIRRIEEQLNKEREQREQLQKDLEERDKRATLDRYRESLIKAAKGAIIPGLVRGDTKAEIDASFAIAKASYEEIATSAKAEAEAQFKKGMPKSINPNTGALEEEELEEKVDNVDMKKYHADPEYREIIQNQIARAYGNGGR